ncbi:MAG: hypothetical protein LJE95_11365 [Acidobacteria bacterium]|nr:hypothetical protein [Acidobacteriota bacterium]
MSSGATSLFLTIGGELRFRFDGLAHELASRIRIHLPSFVAADPSRSPHRGTGRQATASTREAEVITITVGEPGPELPSGGELVLEQDELRIQRSEELVQFSLQGATAWCDTAHGRGGLLLTDSEPGVLDALTGLVLDPLLMELAVGRGWLGLHAAGVAWGGRGVLLPASSGNGKSTIFKAAASAGLDLLSDDLVWVHPAGDELKLWAFPRGAPSEPAPEPTIGCVPLAAVVHPTLSRRKTSRLEPLTQKESFENLVGQSGFLSWGRAAVERFQMLTHVAQVPAWRLEAGSDRHQVPELLRALLRGGC